MAHLDVRVFIRATPEQIWPIIADFASQPSWMEDVRELRVTSESATGVGTAARVTSDLFGLPLVREVMEVATWRPPLEYSVVHHGRLFGGSGLFRLEPVRGGSVFIWQEDIAPPLGPLGELGFRLLVGPHLRRIFSRSADNLRRLAETA